MTDTTTKVREHYGAMGLTDRVKSALATRAPEGQTLTVVQSPFLSCPCALFDAKRNSTLLFSSNSALFTPKHRGVVVPLRLRFLLRRTLPTDPGVSPNASLFNLQLSIEDPDLVGTVSLLRGTSSTGHRTRITRHRAICRIHYLSQSLASDVLLEPEVRSANLPAGHSSVVSEFVGGGRDG
jgi:hypothetical protein